MKQIILYIIFCLFSIQLSAQVGIGTSNPHASAKLEVSSTNQGFLPPRVSLTATNTASPVTAPETGLLVYNISTAGSAPNNVFPGYYYWGGVSSGWVRLTIPTDNAANVTGLVAITNGGTGATTQQTAINALSGTQASGKYLRSDGTNTTLSSLDAADITGTVAVVNGGTGASTLTGILKGNGTGAFTAAVAGTDYQAALTNPVTGTGTANYLPKLTGSTTVGNSQIFDDATSVGIGVNTPNAFAKLDVSSTTQGFLPPRMTYAQRAAIASPAQGLLVYCTNCSNNGELQVYNGSGWTNVAGGTAQVGIGQSVHGGKVAYIFQPGDPGFVSGETHGIVASNDEWTARWGCNGTTLTGANGTGIGTGAQNTIDIIGGCLESGIAAKVCADYSITSGSVTYSDWHLPSITELQRILSNRQAIGGFNSPYILYWSSSQAGETGALVIRTDRPGINYVTHKSGGDFGIGVRAVRFF